MINRMLEMGMSNKLVFWLVLGSFVLTIIMIKVTMGMMPTDNGREFAVNGKVSRGKPRGVGVVFIICFIGICVTFLPIDTEFVAYLFLMGLTMLSGFLDDKSKIPWGEYKKGFIDLIIAIFSVVVLLRTNSISVVEIFGDSIINEIITILIFVIIIWVSINVTNCSDGVDGLCGSLSIITLITCFVLTIGKNSVYSTSILMLIGCILGYLWYNVSPSCLLMGDAGSRAIGYFIAIICVKFLPPPVFAGISFALIADGGIGIVKVFLLRFFNIRILKNVRTPLHDHVRNKLGWSDGQVVFRFSLIQLIVSLMMVYYFFIY